MTESMLNDVEAGISAKILDKFLVRTNRNARLRRSVFITEEAFGPSIREFCLGGHIRNRGEIHWQTPIQERPVEPLKAFHWRERVRIIISEDYVTHCFSSMSCSY